MAKMIYRKDTGDILGVHIFGLHAADLIHEASNAMATHQRVQVSFVSHLTLEVIRFLVCSSNMFVLHGMSMVGSCQPTEPA